MTALTDRAILIRTMHLVDNSNCCDFFACPGPNAKPEPMASCGSATAAYELRNYLERHGGWCPEHEQNLAKCHTGTDHSYRPCPDGNVVCYCNPVLRNSRNRKLDLPRA
jgi:hypothetical protein